MDEINVLFEMIKNFDPQKQDSKYYLMEQTKIVQKKIKFMETEIEEFKFENSILLEQIENAKKNIKSMETELNSKNFIPNDHDDWSGDRRCK